jgi:hypothetical protein
MQRLYTWVKEENCPNFFIPENNMFENRIYGESKQTLQHILELLFTEKFYGLYRCQLIVLIHVCIAFFSKSVSESLVRINSSLLSNMFSFPIEHIICMKVGKREFISRHVCVSISSSVTYIWRNKWSSVFLFHENFVTLGNTN